MRDLYESPDTIVNTKPINTELLYVSYSKYGDDWDGEIHSHYFAELFYVISGEGFLSLRKKSHPLGKGDVVIVNPNVDHVETGNSEKPLEYIVIGMSGIEFEFSDSQQLNYAVFNADNGRDDLLFYFQTLVSEMKAQAPNYTLVCKALLDTLLIKINRRLHSAIIHTEQNVFSKECNDVRRYLDHHFSENINLDILADIAHMNKYHLVHSFKKVHGMSPISYLNHKRISESKNLLITTDHSLSQIAHKLGFSSPSYFSQSFRRAIDMSPNKYRKLNRK